MPTEYRGQGIGEPKREWVGRRVKLPLWGSEPERGTISKIGRCFVRKRLMVRVLYDGKKYPVVTDPDALEWE